MPGGHGFSLIQPSGDEHGVASRRLAALDYGHPFARNAFCAALRVRRDWPEPTELVGDLGFTNLKRVDDATNGTGLYRARVTITVADAAWLAGFAAGKRDGAAASGDNPWERSHFLGA